MSRLKKALSKKLNKTAEYFGVSKSEQVTLYLLDIQDENGTQIEYANVPNWETLKQYLITNMHGIEIDNNIYFTTSMFADDASKYIEGILNVPQ